jgi:hypothetical protein
MGTAEEDTVHLHAMTKDTASAMGTGGCQGMDGTFKAIEYMCLTVLAHFKTFVILVAAHLANSHSATAGNISKLIFFGFHYGTPFRYFVWRAACGFLFFCCRAGV